MGKALQMKSGFVTAPDTTFTAITLGTGDTRRVKAAPVGRAHLLSVWGDWQTAGVARIRSSQMHDDSQGLRLHGFASEVAPLFPLGVKQPLMPHDELTVDMTGSATAGDIESMSWLEYYEDTPGHDAHLMHAREVMSRIEHIIAVQNTISTGTAGNYSGEEALNAEFDQLKANREYAILGYQTAVEACSIGYRAPDFANLRVGGPGNDSRKEMTGRWFMLLSELTGFPTVPIFNANNKSSVLVDAVQDENGADPIVSTILALLR